MALSFENRVRRALAGTVRIPVSPATAWLSLHGTSLHDENDDLVVFESKEVHGDGEEIQVTRTVSIAQTAAVFIVGKRAAPIKPEANDKMGHWCMSYDSKCWIMGTELKAGAKVENGCLTVNGRVHEETVHEVTVHEGRIEAVVFVPEDAQILVESNYGLPFAMTAAEVEDVEESMGPPGRCK